MNSEHQISIKKIDDLYQEACRLEYTDREHCLRLCEHALDMSYVINYQKGICRNLYMIACYQHRLKNYEKAMSCALTAKQYYEKIRNKTDVAKIVTLIGNIHLALGDYHEALTASYQSVTLFQKIGYRPNEAITLGVIGNVFTRMGNYEKALKFHLQSLAIFQELDDQHNVASTLNNIAILYAELKDHEGALKYFHQSSDVFRKLGDNDFLAKTLSNIARILMKYEKSQEALLITQEALELQSSTGNIAGSVIILNQIGILYRKLGDLEQSFRYHSQALEISEVNNLKNTQADSLLNLGQCYYTWNQYNAALEQLIEALAITEQIGYLPLQSEILESLTQVYQALGLFEEALDCHKKFHAVEKQILNKDSEHRMLQLKIQFETEQKELEIKNYRLHIEQQRKDLAALIQTIAGQNELLRMLENTIELYRKNGATRPDELSIHLLESVKNHKKALLNSPEFQSQFDAAYPGFYKRLSTENPALTRQELNVCVLLKLGLSSRNIAKTLFITKRSVDWHRHRIWKKIAIEGVRNLTQFIQEF